jgi:subtilase family serine protease
VTRPAPRAPWLLLALSTASLTLALAPMGAPAEASSARVVVAAALPIAKSDAIVRGPLDVAFDVALAPSRQGALTRFIASLSDPASPNYHHYLSTAQFARRFGAASASVAAVRSYFAGYGLRVGTLSKGHVILHVAGSSANVARAFDTPLTVVRRRDGVLAAQFRAPATLPAIVAHDVAAVAGLSSVESVHAASVISHASSHAGAAACASASGGASATSTTPNSLGGYTLLQQARMYGLDAAYANGMTGAGQTIGVYELAPYQASDVSAFATCYGISPSVTSTLVDGGAGSTQSIENEEATFDVEEAVGLAPGARIQVYTGPNANSGPLDVYQKMADDNTATILTTSWGTCEADPTGSPAAEQVIFEQMAAQGQTIIAAAGDDGSSDCASVPGVQTTSPAVDDPASQPFVTGVGGLTVSNISPLTETVWNNGRHGGGGGGASALWPRPSWQAGTGITAANTMRMVPDLSLMADPFTGFIEYFGGNWTDVGGTSIGSPLMSAITAVAAQSCGTARLGFLNPSLYAMQATGFVDVTTGSNDLYGVGGYSAGPGYDMASGLGSPNPATFLQGLCPATFNTTNSVFTLSTSRPVIGQTPPTLAVTLRDANGAPIPNSQLNVTAAAQSGVVIIDGDRSSEAGGSKAAYIVSTDQNGSATISVYASGPGPVALKVSFQSQTVYSATLHFVSAQAAPARRAGSPTIVRLTPLVAGLELAVRPPSVTGGHPVTGYQYSLNGGATWIRFSASTRRVTIGHLARGRTYQVLVRALTASGPGAPSRPSRVTIR